jgi:hypothetical protein
MSEANKYLYLFWNERGGRSEVDGARVPNFSG